MTAIPGRHQSLRFGRERPPQPRRLRRRSCPRPSRRRGVATSCLRPSQHRDGAETPAEAPHRNRLPHAVQNLRCQADPSPHLRGIRTATTMSRASPCPVHRCLQAARRCRQRRERQVAPVSLHLPFPSPLRPLQTTGRHPRAKEVSTGSPTAARRPLKSKMTSTTALGTHPTFPEPWSPKMMGSTKCLPTLVFPRMRQR